MTHLRVRAIAGKRGSRDRAEKLGAIVVPGGKAKISDVHLVQVHVPRDGLRLEGAGVDACRRTSASPRRRRPRSPPGRCRRGRPRRRSAGGRGRARGRRRSRTAPRRRRSRARARWRRPCRSGRCVAVTSHTQPGAGEHAHERGGQRDVAQVAGEPGLGHRRDGDHQHGARSRPSPAYRPSCGGYAQRDDDGDHAADVDRRARAPTRERLKTSMNGMRGERGASPGWAGGRGRRRAGSRPSRGTRARTTGRSGRGRRRARARRVLTAASAPVGAIR